MWDVGNKKASDNAFHKQQLASLSRHNHKRPAAATTRHQLPMSCLPSLPPAPSCPELSQVPRDFARVARQHLMTFLLLITAKGGKHLQRWGEEGYTAVICHL